jgi:hypothetical protein
MHSLFSFSVICIAIVSLIVFHAPFLEVFILFNPVLKRMLSRLRNLHLQCCQTVHDIRIKQSIPSFSPICGTWPTPLMIE